MSDFLLRLEQRLTFPNKKTPQYPAAVLLAITNETYPKLLLTRRSAALNSHAGEVSLPGGKRESGDTSNISVALRETWEETGISPHAVTLLGELTPQRAKSGIMVQPIVGLIEPNIELIAEVAEIDRLFWAEISELVTQPIESYAITYQGVELDVPSFIVKDEIVWGLTGRIVAELLTTVFDRPADWRYTLTPKWQLSLKLGQAKLKQKVKKHMNNAFFKNN